MFIIVRFDSFWNENETKMIFFDIGNSNCGMLAFQDTKYHKLRIWVLR